MKSALLLKSAVYALLIVYVVKNNFAWFPVSIFLIGSFALYVQPVFKTIPYLFSFVLLIASTLLSLAVFGEAVPLGILALIFAFLFYLLLGIKQVVFLNRLRLSELFYYSIFYVIALMFFAMSAQVYAVKSLIFFLISAGLGRELMSLHEIPSSPGRKAIIWISAFSVMQVAWALGFLTLSFVYSSGIALMFFFTFMDLGIRFYKRALTLKLTAAMIAVFIVLTLGLFIGSKWTL